MFANWSEDHDVDDALQQSPILEDGDQLDDDIPCPPYSPLSSLSETSEDQSADEHQLEDNVECDLHEMLVCICE